MEIDTPSVRPDRPSARPRGVRRRGAGRLRWARIKPVAASNADASSASSPWLPTGCRSSGRAVPG